MFYHRHVVGVEPTFDVTTGRVPSQVPIFVCDNTDTESLFRGNKVVPRLLGTDTHNYYDPPMLVNFGKSNGHLRGKLQKAKASLLTVPELKVFLQDENYGGLKYREKARINQYISAATTRADLYRLGGEDNVRCIGISSLVQQPGDFVKQGLMEVHTCVDGVCTWRPTVETDEVPLYQRYGTNDFVYLGPPGSYAPVRIGKIVDFLDENVARILLQL